MSNSLIMVLNSKFRTADSYSSSNFTISIGQSISIKQMVIQSISLPNTVYNITAQNNVGSLEYNLGTYNITIPIGQYNLAEFIVALQDELTTIDIGSSVSQNPLTQKLEFTFSLSARFVCDSFNPLSKVIGVSTFNQMYYPMVASSSFSASALPDLSGTRNFYICSRTLGQGTNSILQSGDNLPLLLNLQNSVGFGDINYWQNNETRLSLKSYKQYQNAQFIDIQVRDIDGVIVDLNGAEWGMTMLIYYELVFKD